MNWFVDSRKLRMPKPEEALPGRHTSMPVPERHAVLGASLRPPYPAGTEIAEFGLGCFWGAEKLFWQTPGVVSTSVGYAGGSTPNPTYEEVCSGRTGHIETVRVVFDSKVVSYGELLKLFWEEHDPTQGMRQGGDHGTQYRSAILTHGDAQQHEAEASRAVFGERLTAAGKGSITTEIVPAPEFYFAEAYHQQYLDKNPNGYCPNHATGVTLPADFFKSESAAQRAADAAKAIRQAR
jgi:peptide-methionine (S)-S-oxide reductase